MVAKPPLPTSRMLAVPAPWIFSMPESVSVPSETPMVTMKWPTPSDATIPEVMVLVYCAVSVPLPQISVSLPPPPVRMFVAAVAGDGVDAAVAGAVDVAGAGQRQVLDVGRQRVVG